DLSGGGGLHVSITRQPSYRDASPGATAQARRCLQSTGAYTVHGQMDDTARTALVRVEAPFTGDDVTRVQIAATGERQSKVDIAMWGRGIWNEDAVRAMREAIIYGLPSCVAYMPGDPLPQNNAPLPQP